MNEILIENFASEQATSNVESLDRSHKSLKVENQWIKRYRVSPPHVFRTWVIIEKKMGEDEC